MKPRTWQWFDLPFYDDDHDFQFDDPEADGFAKAHKSLGLSGENFI